VQASLIKDNPLLNETLTNQLSPPKAQPHLFITNFNPGGSPNPNYLFQKTLDTQQELKHTPLTRKVLMIKALKSAQ
jgi:hypothetical protein